MVPGLEILDRVGARLSRTQLRMLPLHMQAAFLYRSSGVSGPSTAHFGTIS